MPLLHRKPFVRQNPPCDLRAEEEVFYCKVTNEIFRDYDDFFERTILCNSLVWSCAITGKPGLTYQEALESEKKAKQNLQSFPEPLVVPILYLTTRTHRSRLHELCDEIFAYVKDRYFIGETVEIVSSSGGRQQCKVLEVIPPLQQNGMLNGHFYSKTDGETIVISDSDEDGESPPAKPQLQPGKKKTAIDASLFKYKVQTTKSEKCDILTVKASQVSRKKNLFTRERLKLLLKQHCKALNGVIQVKDSTVAKYKISEHVFSQFFPDEPPTFVFSPASRGPGRPAKNRESVGSDKLTSNGVSASGRKSKAAKEMEKLRKEKEEMRALALEKAKLKKEKAEAIEAKKREKEDKEKKKEELKKMVEEEKLKKKEEKERLKLEKEKEREKLREEKRKYAEYLKQWNKPREDMECDDLKELPAPTPVKTRLPPELFGDALMVLEFLHAFGELFDLQDEFPEGVTLDVLEEALVGNDTEGPLCELLFFFLTAIFQAVAEEEEEVAKDQLMEADTKDLTEALDEDADPTKSVLSAVASLAAAWPQLYQGCTLKELDLDSCTLSEILRLHILSAGADVTSANAKYRYQKQGGFDATDDACVELRLSSPAVLKKLASTPVYDLSPGEKLKILHALCGKLLTLASTRDFIEDNVEILRQARHEFRELKAEQNRREREEAAARIRKKKEEKLREQELKMKEKQDKLKEDEQRASTKESATGEEHEDFDTSTESRETTLKDQGVDTATEDEEDQMASKKGRKGKKVQNEGNVQSQENFALEKRVPLTPEEEEVLKEQQQRKERELMEKIQSASVCANILPLGRDRLYRRYWVFHSVPGLFVEEDYAGLTEDMLLPRPTSLPRERAESQGTEKVQDSSQPREPLGFSISSASNFNQVPHGSIAKELPRPVFKPNLWSVYTLPEQLAQLIEGLNSRGRRESALKETLLQEKNRIIVDKLQVESKASLGRGRAVQHMDMPQLSAEKQLELRLKDLLLDIEDRIYQGTLGAVKAVDRQVWRTALDSGHYELLSDGIKENGTKEVEEMEIDEVNLKLSNKERLHELKNEALSTASTSTSTPQPVNNAVRCLATSLFQIEQGIERKFLKAPLGDAEDTKKDQKGERKRKKEEDQASEKDDASDSGRVSKTVLDRWRESLLSSSSLSQLFLHLSTLDRSIIWSKSILNARCKMCRKKGDAESMVLCDNCDRGHHIYCVRPKLKTVPDGDWLCPECRPKQRSRRVSSRQRFSMDSNEEEVMEKVEEDEEEEEEDEEEESEEEEEKSENEDDVFQEEEEQSPPKRGRARVKLPLKTRGCKSTTSATGRGVQSRDSKRSASRGQENTSKQSGSASKSNTKSTEKKSKSTPASESKLTSRPGSRASSRLSQGSSKSDGSFMELVSPRQRGRGQRTAENTPENLPFTSRALKRNAAADSAERKRKSWSALRKESLAVNEAKKRGRKQETAATSINRRSSGRHSGVHELSACEQIVVDLVRHEDSWPFMKLVSKAQVPDYYDIIKNPIALNIIREKVNNCEYKLASKFVEDIELMFSNCFEYNSRHTNEAKAGARLQAFFHSQAQKLGLQIKNENVDQTTPPPTKRSRI
ncbi:bromodomain adjacent to zinc finger domain protein 1A [Latimeria chalumnae]|uniref:bromodomain adjacent to zinc finger domain protein 1A n=1 Tax=Latimeria chalumnae TaxID=7897 RepID=UPI00313B088A